MTAPGTPPRAAPDAERCFAFRSETDPLPPLPDCDHGDRHGEWGPAFDCGRAEPDALCLLERFHAEPHDWTSLEHVSLVPGPAWGQP